MLGQVEVLKNFPVKMVLLLAKILKILKMIRFGVSLPFFDG